MKTKSKESLSIVCNIDASRELKCGGGTITVF